MPCDVPPATTTIQPSAGHQPLPVAGPLAAADRVHVEHRGHRLAGSISSPSQSRVPTRSRTGTGSPSRRRAGGRAATASSGGRWDSHSGPGATSQRRPGQPLGLGVAALDQQRQVDASSPRSAPGAAAGATAPRSSSGMPCRRIEVSTSTSTRGSRPLPSASRSRSSSRDTVVITARIGRPARRASSSPASHGCRITTSPAKCSRTSVDLARRRPRRRCPTPSRSASSASRASPKP